MFLARATSGVLLALITSGLVAGSHGPSLDINDINQLKNAASTAMKNLMSYYKPNSEGVFDTDQTPWHESGMIWGMHFDYVRWSGDTQFLDTVTQALVDQSNGDAHEFLEPSHPDFDQWNDDILWPSQAVVAAAELYGPKATLPGTRETWIDLADRTYQQASSQDQLDSKCGGGIYWYRDRKDSKGSYKSLITQLEFISQGARNYMITKDSKTLKQAQVVLEWVVSSGLANLHTGVLMDGVDVANCKKFQTNQWSYNYGQFLGSLVWMYRATKEQRYINMASPFLDLSRRLFAGTNTAGVIAELCERRGKKCGRDPQGFKAIYARNLAYLYRASSNQTMKAEIRAVIDTSLKAMVARSCDLNWNCASNWIQDTTPVKSVRSQHVSTALLVAALGIHGSSPQKYARSHHAS